MENAQNKESRIGEIIILLLVLVCATLILIDMTTNLINEINTQNNQVVINETLMPTLNARFADLADYTPLSSIDS